MLMIKNKYMKNNFLHLALCLLLVGVGFGCKKSFFDAPTQDGSINDGSAFKTKADFDNAVIGTYANLQGGSAAGEAWLRVPGSIMQDIVNVTVRPEPIVSYMNSNNNSFLSYWTELYKTINLANIVITRLETVPDGILTAVEKTRIDGQVKFLRGFSYFMLTKAYGDIPMPLSPYSPEQNTMACTPTAQVFAQVVKDLDDAVAKLPETEDWGTAQRGRVGKGAALAYLANTHMYLKNWPAATKASTDLLALTRPKYELAANMQSVFTSRNKTNPAVLKENIFEVQYREKSGDNFQWGSTPNTGHLWATNSAPRNVGNKFSAWGGWGEIIMTKKVAEAYTATDKRRTQMLKLWGETYKGELMADTMRAADWVASLQLNGAFSTKYWHGDGDQGNLSPQNLPIFRFAEALLNYAEIQFYSGNPTAGYITLNLVRARSGVINLPVSSSEPQFLKDIMEERRRELLFEPNLWFHYTRTGTAKNFLQTVHGVDMQDRWKYFPIPQRERDLNPNMCANGW